MAIGKHQSAKPGTTTWITPSFIIDAVGGANSFDLDPCAADRMPWPTARNCYTKTDDGLKKPWYGRVWLNPPYTNNEIVKWMGRLADHGNGIACIFARTETVFFQDYVFGKANAILFIKKRISFHREDGSLASGNSGAPSVLCAYGKDNADILKNCGIDGAYTDSWIVDRGDDRQWQLAMEHVA